MRLLFRSFSYFVVICLVWAASGCSSGSNQEEKAASLAISDEKSEDKADSRDISDRNFGNGEASLAISDNNSESKSASDAIAPSDTESIAMDALLRMVHESYVRDNLDRAIELATCGNLRAKAEGDRKMEALFDFYYGVCQTWLGQEREGVARMHNAVAVISRQCAYRGRGAGFGDSGLSGARGCHSRGAAGRRARQYHRRMARQQCYHARNPV